MIIHTVTNIMKIVVQRVSKASVSVDGDVKGSIKQGLLLLVGIHHSDTKKEADWCSKKISGLRIFDDKDGKMNLSVMDTGGEILVISQFTLYGNTKKGMRPSFIEAAKPDLAEPIYDYIVNQFKQITGLRVQEGVFGAMMDVDLINNGPVTLVVEK